MIDSNYSHIVSENLRRFYSGIQPCITDALPADRDGNGFRFSAFGRPCTIEPERVLLDDEVQTGPVGILITLYALHAGTGDCIVEPFRAFRELPESGPYEGAFVSHTEIPLLRHVGKIEENRDRIVHHFRGRDLTGSGTGDFAFLIFPLPKIALRYSFYHEDEEFPASVSCLFSNNASSFLPTAALADAGEYASLEIMRVAGGEREHR